MVGSESDDIMMLEQLQVRIVELEKSISQRPAIAKKLSAGKSFMFAGIGDDQKDLHLIV